MAKNDGGPALPCSKCENTSIYKQGNQWLCAKHYRIAQMRSNAKRHNKFVPEYSEIEKRLDLLICPDCGKSMNLLSKDGKCTVATLQHYRDGSWNIVCRSCNTRHAYMPGDTYRQMDKNNKYCPKCKSIKSFSQFSVDNGRSGNIKLKSYCKSCSKEAHREWKRNSII